MATITVYGSRVSVSTRRVLLTLEEKNVEYTFVPLNLAQGQQKASQILYAVRLLLTLN